VTATHFDRKACKPLAEGEDPVDDVRVPNPTHHRFVLCGANDLILGRFVLFEEALAAQKQITDRTVVYAIKSGKAMSFTAPQSGSVKGRAASLNR
jgi:hypothetical protein